MFLRLSLFSLYICINESLHHICLISTHVNLHIYIENYVINGTTIRYRLYFKLASIDTAHLSFLTHETTVSPQKRSKIIMREDLKRVSTTV